MKALDQANNAATCIEQENKNHQSNSGRKKGK